MPALHFAPAAAGPLADALAAVPREPGEVLVVWIAERNAPDLPVLVDALKARRVPFCGALYPGIVQGGRYREAGCVAFGVPAVGPPRVVRGLSGAGFEPLDMGPGAGARSAFVFYDGLSTGGGGFLAALADAVPSQIRYFGGGGGRLTLERGPCVFTPEGAFEDAAVVLFSPLQMGVGVRHGWERFAGPLVVTGADGNRIHELNWDDAFDVYRQHLEPVIGRPITPETFLEVAKDYPLGLYREGREDLVRNPYRTEGGAIDCIGDVPAHAVVYVLRSTPERVVAAAGAAAAAAVAAQGDGRPRLSLLADCVSRRLYLGDAFGAELRAVSDVFEASGAAAPDGILTMGEVVSSATGAPGLCNKTCSPALLSDVA